VQITTGNANTYLGWNTGPATSSYAAISNSAAIGANAEVLNSNHIILGDNHVSVGISLSGDATGLRLN
jgi:serine acetyltransferase